MRTRTVRTAADCITLRPHGTASTSTARLAMAEPSPPRAFDRRRFLPRMAGSDLRYRPVGDLAARVKSRQVPPVKLAETCLDRLEKLGPQLNAVVTVMRDSALSEARAAEKAIAHGGYKGPLHGIPYGVK